MNSKVESILLIDDALEAVRGGGMTAALVLGGVYALGGAGAGVFAAGPAGALAGGAVGAVGGFVSGLFMPEGAASSGGRYEGASASACGAASAVQLAGSAGAAR